MLTLSVMTLCPKCRFDPSSFLAVGVLAPPVAVKACWLAFYIMGASLALISHRNLYQHHSLSMHFGIVCVNGH